MIENSNWFIFFVVTGKENTVKNITDKLLKDTATPFIPTVQKVFKSSKQIFKTEKKLFPGYVFVKSIFNDTEFYEQAKKNIFHYKEFIRILRYDDNGNYSIKETEKNVLSKLFNKDFCIEDSKGIIIGDNVYINDGPLIGMESIIRKIDRHKREAQIEIDFFGEPRLTKVSLEIIEKK